MDGNFEKNYYFCNEEYNFRKLRDLHEFVEIIYNEKCKLYKDHFNYNDELMMIDFPKTSEFWKESEKVDWLLTDVNLRKIDLLIILGSMKRNRFQYVPLSQRNVSWNDFEK